MALMNCRECGKQMSSQAKACPACGAPRASAGLVAKYLFQTIFGLVVAVVMFQCAFNIGKQEPKPAPPVALATPAKTPQPASLPPSLHLTDKTEIDRHLSKFGTYNGKPLRALLDEYGLPIDYVLIAPIESFTTKREWDRPGDRVVTIMLESGRGKRLPCDLEYMRKALMLDALLRDGKLQLDLGNPEPLLHWAATGKCLQQ